MITMAMVTMQNYEHYGNGNKYYGNGNNAKNSFAIFSPGTACTELMWQSRKTPNTLAMATMYCNDDGYDLFVQIGDRASHESFKTSVGEKLSHHHLESTSVEELQILCKTLTLHGVQN